MTYLILLILNITVLSALATAQINLPPERRERKRTIHAHHTNRHEQRIASNFGLVDQCIPPQKPSCHGSSRQDLVGECAHVIDGRIRIVFAVLLPRLANLRGRLQSAVAN